MSEWLPEAVVVGAACLDIKGLVPDQIHPATSNPGVVRIAVGGVARNIAENLSRLGMKTTLLAAVARDPFGHQLVKHTGAVGVDVSHVLFSRESHTAAYVALFDGGERLVAAIDDTQVIQELTPRYIYDRRRLFRDARVVIVDANTPLRTAETIIRLVNRYEVPLCLDPVSYGLAARYRDLLEHFDILAAGAVEVEALTGQSLTSRDEAAAAARSLVGRGIEIVIINLGSDGVVYASTEDNGYVPAIHCEIVDPTGATDALTAALIYGLVNDVPLDESVWLGISAATLTLQCEESVCADLSLDLVYQQLVS
jgi:pseudouridine kinase